MINKQILQKAHESFVAKDYPNALLFFGFLSSLEPQNEEYKMYAMLCDITNENEIKAVALYDQYAIEKSISPQKAIGVIYNMINTYDGDQELVSNILKNMTTQAVESLEAIHYNDFMELVKNRGSFKIAFEDIMFSTKITIDSKEELFNFVDQLITHGFNTVAYSYLDNFNQLFSYDKHIKDLYQKLKENQLENYNKQ